MAIATKFELTFAEYLAHDDGTNNHYELVDGELVLMPQPSPIHSDIIEFLDRLLYAEVTRLGLDLRVKSGGVGLRTGIKTAREPDLCVIEGIIWREIRATQSSAVLEVPILLSVEVVSPGQENADRDYVQKKREYAQLGVKEYWIIDPQLQMVSVLQLSKSRKQEYAQFSYQGGDRLASEIFPKLELTASQILNPD